MINQPDEFSCFPTAIYNLGLLFGKTVNYNNIRKQSRCSKKSGTEWSNMYKLVGRYLKHKQFNFNKLYNPILVNYRTQNKLWCHSAIIISETKKYYIMVNKNRTDLISKITKKRLRRNIIDAFEVVDFYE